MKFHTFRGVRYRVANDEVIEGYAEVPKKRVENVIYIASNLRGLRELEVACHEAMHCEDPDIKEQVIDRRAGSLAKFLWRLGYRRPK